MNFRLRGDIVFDGVYLDVFFSCFFLFNGLRQLTYPLEKLWVGRLFFLGKGPSLGDMRGRMGCIKIW